MVARLTHIRLRNKPSCSEDYWLFASKQDAAGISFHGAAAALGQSFAWDRPANMHRHVAGQCVSSVR